MGHVLRQFRRGDEKFVKDLILDILAREYPFERTAYPDSDLDRIGEIYGGDREIFFVVEKDGEIIGTAGVKEDDKNEALLRRLFVAPRERKKGIGMELVQKAVSFCKGKGYKRILFRCTDRMREAMGLCKKAGFKEAEALEVSGFKIHKLALVI